MSAELHGEVCLHSRRKGKALLTIRRRQKPMAEAEAMVRRRLAAGLASESKNVTIPYSRIRLRLLAGCCRELQSG